MDLMGQCRPLCFIRDRKSQLLVSPDQKESRYLKGQAAKITQSEYIVTNIIAEGRNRGGALAWILTRSPEHCEVSVSLIGQKFAYAQLATRN